MMELYNPNSTIIPSDRNSFNINIPEKAWRELYLPPYKAAAEVRVDNTYHLFFHVDVYFYIYSFISCNKGGLSSESHEIG